jgi:CRISPR-associated exonuclease Cas4
MPGPEGDDMLQMSGIQHFCFCRRQWALIHLEQQWRENLRTTEGHLLHEVCHDVECSESRRDFFTVRGMQVASQRLQLSGACDVVEFHAAPAGVALAGRAGLWVPVPVEYKRGQSKESDADRLQLCAQAMALEEMLVCEVPEGFLFYGETRRRECVALTPDLRRETQDAADEMNEYFRRGYTPRVKPGKHCNACSLKELCLPKLCTRLDAARYVRDHVEEAP